MTNNNSGHILIVDDHRTNLIKISFAVKKLGHTVETAADGGQALQLLRAQSFDLVLLDIVMPEMDGYQVLKQMKADNALRDIPVIVISAEQELSSVVKGIELGAEDYLPRTFDPVLLKARIKTCLEKKRFRDQELEYLRQVDRLTEAAAAVENSTFNPDNLSDMAIHEDALGQLARVFRRMAAEVALREQHLKQQVHDLRLELDKSGQAHRMTHTGDTQMPEGGTAADIVYQLIHDELAADGKPDLNLASFVTTWMDDTAENLALENINKNLINTTEYPQTEIIHQSVITMIARLFHADVPPHDEADRTIVAPPDFIGTTTVGSSEAVMLALLAHKWNWKKKQQQNPHHSSKDRPFLIIGTHTHACFAKFARYFEVGVKWVYLETDQYAISAKQVQAILETKIVDDPQVMAECGYTVPEVEGRTIGELVMAIGCVVGTTFTGDIDDVAGIDHILTNGNWDIPIHVDAASSGFVLPFTQAEEDEHALQWDFKLRHVESINVSNHKYGLVYPGLGTVVFRDPTIVPAELLIKIDYLSGEMRNYSLNFSRPSAGVILQYYNFLHLGKAGYRRMIQSCLNNAQYIAQAIQELPTLNPYFEVISRTEYFPVIALRLKHSANSVPPFTLAKLTDILKVKGWIVPIYHLPPNIDHIEVMRIVIRPHFDREMAQSFLDNLEAAVIVSTDSPEFQEV